MDKSLDRDKMILATQRDDFAIEQAFKLFTHTTLDRLTSAGVADSLNSLGIAMSSPNEAQLLVSRYDADGDGKLSFWEFSNIFLPLDT